MKRTITLFSAMALASSLTFAQEAPAGAPKAPRGPGKGRPTPEQTFKKLDTDHNKSISLAEFQASPMGQRDAAKAEEIFKKIDTDNDGEITIKEFMAHRPSRPGAGKPGGDRPNPDAIFKTMDINPEDGSVSLEEFQASPMGKRLGDKAEGVFEKLDTDGTPGISLEEFKAFRPQRGGNRGGNRGAGAPGKRGGNGGEKGAGAAE